MCSGQPPNKRHRPSARNFLDVEATVGDEEDEEDEDDDDFIGGNLI